MSRPLAVFLVFLRLGVTSFGGPVAHLGYFHAEFVERRGWLDDKEYAELVALCQFLPGPASSQVGFAIGLLRAGTPGALLAFVGFTLPSALLMLAIALGAGLLADGWARGAVDGLMVVAVAIVAQAVLGMARTLTPDRVRASIALVGALNALFVGGSLGQILAIVLGGVAGVLLCRVDEPDAARRPRLRFPVSITTGWVSLGVFALLLVGLPVVAATTGSPAVAFVDAFYRAGSLVFGGGHVVLPLLESSVVEPGWVSGEQFLTGYAAAQAMPGPLFTFATYLGALASAGPGGAWGALIATVAIFLPGFLLLVGVLPLWNTLRTRVWAAALMRGAGAAVVGILAVALYDPVFTTAVSGPAPFALALACFVLLVAWKAPPWTVVLLGATAGALTGLLASP